MRYQIRQIIGFVAVSMLIAIPEIGQAQGGPPTVDVNVTNDSSAPVPVTATSPLPVTVTGETTGNVTVTNDAESPVPVTVQSAAEHVMIGLTTIVEAGDTQGSSDHYEVPDDKRLFIDSVACDYSLTPLADQISALRLVVDPPNFTSMPIVNRRFSKRRVRGLSTNVVLRG